MELAGPGDLGLATDWRLVAAVAALFVAAFAKGVAGLGVPIIATPIIALIYDLKSAIVVVTLSMTLSDLLFVVQGRQYVREARAVVPYILAAMIGVTIGTQLLVRLDDRILAGVLGAVVMIFVVTSWFNVLPRIDHRRARLAGPPFGLIAGIVQGSAGASGPLTTMYLLSLEIPRYLFMFVINVIFLVLDTTLFTSLIRLGLYTPPLLTLALLACIPVGLGLWVGAVVRKYVDDQLFRRFVLIMLLVSALNLFVKVFS